MLNNLKKNTIKLSLAAVLAITPVSMLAASSSGMVDGSSESTSALLEGPNVEQQINRVSVGMGMVRLNTVILNEMPISADSVWVDELVQPMSTEMYKKIRVSNAVKNDPYYATAMLTNVILGRAALDLTPLNARLYLELNAIYKNPDNAPANEPNKYDAYATPDIYKLPSFDSMDTFTNFAKENMGKKVEKIEVNATNFNRYENIKLAAIALAPKKYEQKLLTAKDEFEKAVIDVETTDGRIEELKMMLDDDKNNGNPNKSKWEEEKSQLETELTALETTADEKEEAYSMLIDEAALEIEANIQDDFETIKVPLAQKLEKVFDLVDNNAIGAVSMFVSATAHLTKNGLGTLDDEIKALTIAQAATNLVGNQKQFIIDRVERMGKGALMLLPNIAIGTYYATIQTREAGRYQKLIDKVLEIAEAQAEAKAAAAEAEASTQTEEAK